MENKMLREIANDVQTPKKRDSKVQNVLYENLDDSDFYEGLDYDDQTQIFGLKSLINKL